MDGQLVNHVFIPKCHVLIIVNTTSIKSVTQDFPNVFYISYVICESLHNSGVIYLSFVICRLLHNNEIYHYDI